MSYFLPPLVKTENYKLTIYNKNNIIGFCIIGNMVRPIFKNSVIF